MSDKKPLVSVIVLNWNGKKFLKNCLSSLLQQTYQNYEIVFMDNGSTDGSVDFVKTTFKGCSKIKIVALERNYGFSKGNNIGFKHAKDKYVISLNNDTEVQPNFVEELVKVAESDEKIGSVGCKIVNYDGSAGYGPVFTNKGFIVPFLFASDIKLIRRRWEKVCNTYSANLANCGCAVLYRKKVLEIVGGFDEDFWSDWEDHDLGFRITLAGFKSVYTPKTAVFHAGAGSEGFSAKRSVRIVRNMLFTYIKNYEPENVATRFMLFLFIFLPITHIARIFLNEWRIFRKGASLSLELLIGRRRGYFALFKAYASFLHMLPFFILKRKKVQKLRKVSDRVTFSRTKMSCLL